jgi:hypothetical protein
MLSYPLDLSFKIVTIGTRIKIKDAAGRQVAYVRKQKFKLKENVGGLQRRGPEQPAVPHEG